MRRVLLLGLAVVVAVVVGVTHGRLDERGGSSAAVEASSVSVPSPVVPRSTTADAAASPTPSATGTSDGPRGGALARAWLTGYLSRATRDEMSWVDAVAPLSTPELVTDLRSAGPDLVGLEQLDRWQVTKVEPFEPIDPPVNTESRQLLAYAATVIDGTRTVEKPFELYAYLQPDGRWLVGMVDQPYSSEG